jgi:hypothetical protein
VIGPFDYPGCVPPEYEHGEPAEHVCSFCDDRMAIEEHAEHECQVVCSECRTVTRTEFASGGRCEDCDAPVEAGAEAQLYDRLIAARNKAALEKRTLDARKLQMFADQVQKIEVALVEMEGIKF